MEVLRNFKRQTLQPVMCTLKAHYHPISGNYGMGMHHYQDEALLNCLSNTRADYLRASRWVRLLIMKQLTQNWDFKEIIHYHYSLEGRELAPYLSFNQERRSCR